MCMCIYIYICVCVWRALCDLYVLPNASWYTVCGNPSPTSPSTTCKQVPPSESSDRELRGQLDVKRPFTLVRTHLLSPLPGFLALRGNAATNVSHLPRVGAGTANPCPPPRPCSYSGEKSPFCKSGPSSAYTHILLLPANSSLPNCSKAPHL